MTGIIERTVFTIFVAIDISGAAPAMIAWLALKLLTNWNRSELAKEDDARPFAFTALLAGLVSMLFAGLGGKIGNNSLWPELISKFW